MFFLVRLTDAVHQDETCFQEERKGGGQHTCLLFEGKSIREPRQNTFEIKGHLSLISIAKSHTLY